MRTLIAVILMAVVSLPSASGQDKKDKKEAQPGDFATDKVALDKELVQEAIKTLSAVIKKKGFDEARAFVTIVTGRLPDAKQECDAALEKVKDKTGSAGKPAETEVEKWGKLASEKMWGLAKKYKSEAQAKRVDVEGDVCDVIVEYVLALARLNTTRKDLGLAEVAFDWDLTYGAALHAKYVALNPAGQASTQVEGKPGFSEDGKKAAPNCFSWQARTLSQWMEASIAAAFNRVYLFRPALERVGFGQHSAGQVGVAVDVLSGIGNGDADKGKVVMYPKDGAVVAIDKAREGVEPVPGKEGTLGFPITITFYDADERVGDVKAKLIEGQKELPAYLSTPDDPAVKQTYATNLGTIILIPKAVLKKGGTYGVSVEAKLKGDSFKKAWTFKTAK